MKIAYFILTHHKFYQLRWLWNAIYSPNDIFCIHVDAKSPDQFYRDVSELAARYPNVVMLPRRSVNWGCWSQVSAELAAMRYMTKSEYTWDYWINVSGQDYPLQTREYIHDTLAASRANFIEAISFEEFAKVDANNPHLRMQGHIEFRGRIRRLPMKIRLPKAFRYRGSSWHMLRREFVEWALQSSVLHRASRHIQFQIYSDELFFQALLMNSPFRDERQDFRRFILWPGPKILDQSDAPAMLESQDFFGRKFDAKVDAAVLRRLAEHSDYDVPQDAG